MVVEHTFVTTLERDDALAHAHALLERLGFLRGGAGEWTRGADKPAAFLPPAAQPQALRLDYDRGRVTLAASLLDAGQPTPAGRELLLALASALEQVLCQGAAPARFVDGILSVERQGRAEAEARRRRRNRILGLVLVGPFILALLIIAIASAAR